MTTPLVTWLVKGGPTILVVRALRVTERNTPHLHVSPAESPVAASDRAHSVTDQQMKDLIPQTWPSQPHDLRKSTP